MKHLRNYLVLLTFSLITLSSCNRRIHKTTPSLGNTPLDDLIIHWNFDSVDSIRINDEYWDRSIYGEYQLDSSHIVELDYSTRDKATFLDGIENANLFIRNNKGLEERCKEYLKEDFEQDGWTYHYILYYLLDKDRAVTDYKVIEESTSFKNDSDQALQNLRLKRIGFYDNAADQKDNGVILDFDIFDRVDFDVLVIYANKQGEFLSISIEG